MTRPNAELAYKVLDHIDADPKSWMQNVWVGKLADCETVACFAGWACVLSGDVPDIDPDDNDEAEDVRYDGGRAVAYIPERAAALLGIDADGGEQTGYRLFEPQQDREDLGRLVAEIFGPRPTGGDR